MSPPTACNQEGCGKPAAYRFTWPGKDEAGICEDHAPMLRSISAIVGYVQLIPLRSGLSGGEEPHEEGK